MRLRLDVFVLLYKPSEATQHFFQQKGCTFFLTRASIYTRRPWLTADLRQPHTRLAEARLHDSDLVGYKTFLSEKRKKKKTISFPGGGEHPLCTGKHFFFLSVHAVLHSVNKTFETLPLIHISY